jgi:Phosphoribosyltransferase
MSIRRTSLPPSVAIPAQRGRFQSLAFFDYRASAPVNMRASTPAAPRPFDDIRALLAKMPKADEAARAAAREREAQLTKPAGSLGRLEEIAEWLAAGRARRGLTDQEFAARSRAAPQNGP